MSKKILVLGATGMLGSAIFNEVRKNKLYQVWGTLRSASNLRYFSKSLHEYLISGVDVLDHNSIVTALGDIKPDVVINCVGLIKQFSVAKDPLVTLPINSMFPHQLSKLCSLINARLVHISTDCVFNGRRGMYTEDDISDAEDLYGKSKYIGELHDLPHVVTLRTSIVGHELNSKASLVDWFLSQKNAVKGYKKAVFSGLPTVELAKVIRDFVIPNVNVKGLYHVSSDPIDKYSLLNIIADVYGKEIEIIPDDYVQIDRSLDSSKFQRATGYAAPGWPELVREMHNTQ